MKAIIKDTLGADKTIQMADGEFISYPHRLQLRTKKTFANPYKSVYVTTDNGMIEIFIGDQSYQLFTNADGQVEVNVLQNEAGEIVGLFV